MSHVDQLFDPENALPEDIDGFDYADIAYLQEKEEELTS